MRARVRTHTQEKFFLVKEDVLPGIQGGAGHGEGETFRREEHLLQQGALCGKDGVLAAGQPVMTVYQQNFHAAASSCRQ